MIDKLVRNTLLEERIFKFSHFQIFKLPSFLTAKAIFVAMNSFEKLTEAAAYLKPFCTPDTKAGVVLGSGLANFVQEIKVGHEIDYDKIPHFPVSTVEGHHGKLIFGSIAGKPIIAMSGRFHFYEGYAPEDVAFPIRVMKFLGIETVFISNAAGGVKPGFKVGDLMIINDHIALATVNPLLGQNDDRLGPRFPDMSEPYKKELVSKAKAIAKRLNIEVKEGVYFGVTGPTFETRAEYKMIHVLGGDAVGMSTVQEVIAANHAGMSVFAMSVITDIGIREEDNIITHEEVLQAAREAEPKFSAIFREMIASL
jgi:purine-nucleoside phosphorylase